MGTYERRTRIWETLRQRKSDTVENLAAEFGVSERTIRRDINVLITEHPITTVCGRYGGILVLDTALPGYFSKAQEDAMKKAVSIIRELAPSALGKAEIKELEKILQYYVKSNYEINTSRKKQNGS